MPVNDPAFESTPERTVGDDASGSARDAQLPLAGMWRVEHPGVGLAISTIGVLGGLIFLVRGLLVVGSGVTRPVALTAYLLFWSVVLAINASGLRRSIRVIKDPDAERARVEQRVARVSEQPRKTLLWKAAVFFAGITILFIGSGVSLLLRGGDGDAERVFGIVLTVVGAVLGIVGAWGLRHPRV